ncbi:hypothetical protein IT084_02645 [Desulfallas sp. Bu1-1]|uniref:hypothetical protein n=1 Tax=Desulfallas sp. Bu1-1 TaxID=2787620 RepID=UPI0018A0F445|nr:hypothetical protein [Desulfallas sp. Bu1-1]MBF7081873.1 hypothetical protein [Desulfallas sp. Bu1-1]
MQNNLRELNKLIGALREEIAGLALAVVEEWLSPEEARQRILAIKSFYTNKYLKRKNKNQELQSNEKIIEDILEELDELSDLIMEESTVPDVIQEYLLFLASGSQHNNRAVSY